MTMIAFISRWGWWIFAALLSSIINWMAVAKTNRKMIIIFKPLTMLILIFTAWIMKNALHSDYLRRWFIPALFFSLCGDVFLLFSGQFSFLLGLISFLIAHICYVVGLNRHVPSSGVWVIAVCVMVVYLLVYPKIDKALKRKGENGLRIPAGIYAFVLSVMLASAWSALYRFEWSLTAKLSAVMGGSLFYLSDLLLAWNRFVDYVHKRDVFVMITYHLAQIFLTACIALGP